MTVDEEAHTDTEPGWKLWRCMDCGDEYTENTPAGHVYTCYEEAAQQALWNELTTGTSDTTLSPNQTCTGAQAVIFLRRAMEEE